MKIDWPAWHREKLHDPKRGIDLQKAIEDALDLVVTDQHIWNDKFPGAHAHALVWALKDSLQGQLTKEHGWKHIDNGYGLGCYAPDKQESALSIKAHKDAKAKEKQEAREIHLLDKHGWPVETVKGRKIRNFLRLLIHTRKIKRGPWKTHDSSTDSNNGTQRPTVLAPKSRI